MGVVSAVSPDGTPVSFADLPLWAEVDLGRIRANIGRLKAHLRAGARLLAVVKADGYGHGAPLAAAGLRAEGIWSHFAVAEDVLNPYTRQQFECFTNVLAALGPAADGLMHHLANSAGLLTFPEAHFDMVRTGIAVYGIHPSPELAGLVDLDPAMSFKSRVGLVKVLAAGESVSYGQRYTMPAEGVVATVPCGYADGLRRGLTNAGDVLIRGRRYRIAGTVTMDHVMV